MRHGTVLGRAAAGVAGLLAAIAAVPAAAQAVKAGVDAWGRHDYAGAVAQWRGPAIAGDADAQYNLGQAYKFGRGVPVDPVLAQSWFRKAALQGHPLAEDSYGIALYKGGDFAGAVPWLEKSVARGEPRAQLVLGTMLFNGDGVKRDYPRAYALMTRASQAGLGAASETLAQMDQYMPAADREAGLDLARRYAAQPTPAAGVLTVAGDEPARAPAKPRLAAKERAPVAKAPAPAPAAKAPVTVAAAKPAAKTPAPRAATGAWRIQLGAFRDQGNAEQQWRQVRARLGAAQPVYAKAGAVIRLQAGGFAGRAEAQRACKASGVSCVVVAP